MDTMRDRFTTVATELLDTDPRIVVLLADIGTDRFAASGAARLRNVGIREQLLIGVAAGHALEGFRPIVHPSRPVPMSYWSSPTSPGPPPPWSPPHWRIARIGYSPSESGVARCGDTASRPSTTPHMDSTLRGSGRASTRFCAATRGARAPGERLPHGGHGPRSLRDGVVGYELEVPDRELHGGLPPLHRALPDPAPGDADAPLRTLSGGEGYLGYYSGFPANLSQRGRYHPDLTNAERGYCVMFAIMAGLVAGMGGRMATFICLPPKPVGRVHAKRGIVFGDPDLEEGDRRAVVHLFERTMAEDRVQLANLDRGLRSRSYRPGPLGPPDVEGTVRDLYRYIARRLG